MKFKDSQRFPNIKTLKNENLSVRVYRCQKCNKFVKKHDINSRGEHYRCKLT